MDALQHSNMLGFGDGGRKQGEKMMDDGRDDTGINANGPHHACSQASERHSNRMGWAHHNKEPCAIPFTMEGSSSASAGHCRCRCCEQPFESELTRDLYVAYARWDNYKKQYIPMCMCDNHQFMEPPLIRGGMDFFAAWCFLIFFLLILVVVGGSTSASPMYHYHQSLPHSEDYYHWQYDNPYPTKNQQVVLREESVPAYFDAAAWIVVAYVGVLVLVLACASAMGCCTAASPSSSSRKEDSGNKYAIV